MPGWYRSVLGRDGGFEDDENDTEHDLWRDYFEETLWEPHGSLEKGAPFLWSSCAFTLASFLTVAEDEYRNISGSNVPFDPLTDHCPPSLEKEMESLTAVTKFCRWTFSLLEHSADAKVIWETAKRCCPINNETKREYRKFTKQLMQAMEASGEEGSDEYAVLQLLQRMAKTCSSEKLKPLTSVSDVRSRLKRILPANAAFVRRMKLFWRCLTDENADASANSRSMQIPTLGDIAHSNDPTFDRIWQWCMDRMLSKTHLGSSKVGDKCEHTEGCSEAEMADRKCGVGIVLLLEQCRIAVVGGSMAAYFPCPYVDAHGEEDVGLQRGRPLRLDMARYKYLESLWLSHRIFTEVSRQRNQRDPQYTINLSYL
uniref:E3 ubiquitin-protein ligase n=1 Tax=Phytophthora ramorum TaxID=164328 RepID=H3HBR4_PHYRM